MYILVHGRCCAAQSQNDTLTIHQMETDLTTRNSPPYSQKFSTNTPWSPSWWYEICQVHFSEILYDKFMDANREITSGWQGFLTDSQHFQPTSHDLISLQCTLRAEITLKFNKQSPRPTAWVCCKQAKMVTSHYTAFYDVGTICCLWSSGCLAV